MSINLTLIGQMITFALLVILTMKYIWPPVIQAMKERQQKIADGLSAAEQGHEMLRQTRVQVEQMLREAKTQTMSIVDQANHRAAELIEQGRMDARTEANKILHQAELNIAQQMQLARNQLKQETANLAVAIASRLIGHHLDEAANSELIDRLVTEVAG